MARKKGSANLAASLEVLAGAPLDARQTVQTKEELTASGSFPYFYVGMETYVVSENKKYRFVGTNPTDLSDWEDAGLGGDASLQSNVTSNLAIGGIKNGQTLSAGTTFTEFVQKLLVTEIAPTVTFTASGSGVREVGSSVRPSLALQIVSLGTATPTYIKFYNGSTQIYSQKYINGTTIYDYAMAESVTSNTTIKAVLEYTKSDGTSATLEKTATYTFVMASYYGPVSTAPTDKAGITALTKDVKNTKALTATFSLDNKRSCYCYPASFGNLSSIKDANNFEYINSYTKTSVTVDETAYNVYTLTDPVTATGFKQIFA